MKFNETTPNRRILVVDDSSTIQHDFLSILAPAQNGSERAVA